MSPIVEQTLSAVGGAVIGTFIPALSQRIFGKRKTLAEDRSAEIDNAVKAVTLYRELLDDSGERLIKAHETINKLEYQIQELMKSNKMLDIQHRELMVTNQFLVDELQKYKQLNGKTP